MAGLKVVAIKTKADGNLDLQDLEEKAKQYSSRLAAFMV
jgi:glycine dehydrogenase